ncbi:probable leucine-rich repeat receptor-like protein kinase At5g49770 isoform X2 [Chenopodium quinoa]|uniref:probable leucine-rich repeat receptor-like protein kinase At5g49770 isoform X2 n=1 Tax=Chenopodium quinoa TaxID=63459 RepID=UPI000B77FC47|nr:probable leucine-rich repeat receptor-like protein kinase At5g49770 isoform X2 [Chenopodium quinoa]
MMRNVEATFSISSTYLCNLLQKTFVILITHTLILDNNKFEGSIPSAIGLVNEMEVLRLDWNSFSGSVPSNISNLTEVTKMDMSNNSFDTSDVPSWFTTLPSLITL